MNDPNDYSGSWTIDAETRLQLRVERIRKSINSCDLTGAVVEAEELLDEQPDHPTALRLLAGCLLDLGDAVGALQVFKHLTTLGAVDFDLMLHTATAAYESCELELCVAITDELIAAQPDCGEAHFYRGLCLERMQGRSAAAFSAFTAAYHLDPKAFPMPLHVRDSEWEELVKEALLQTPSNIREFWSGIPILIEDFPEIEEAQKATPPIPPNVLGLYIGMPPESGDPWQERPEGLRIFRRNLLRSFDREELVESIANVFEEEAAGWLGLPVIADNFSS